MYCLEDLLLPTELRTKQAKQAKQACDTLALFMLASFSRMSLPHNDRHE
jgi:hypothetical protein